MFYRNDIDILYSLSVQLDRMERKLNLMSAMEDRLDSVITSVQQTVSSVVSLVGQVLAKLEAAGAGVDLSDETSTLETLQSDLQNAADNMNAALNPTGEPPVEGETTGETQPV
jgi:hypothetical protein